MDEFESWLNELSQRTGASVEPTDLARLRQTNPGDDTERLMGAYQAQYDLRGRTQTTGSGPDSSERTRQGYGSARNETADDRNAFRSNPTAAWLSYGSGGGGGGMGGGSSALQERADGFWQQLAGRAGQSLAIDKNDPIVRGQADAYAANEERARRNYVSDAAESLGPYANVQGEKRMAAERMGQRTGTFEAELVTRELTARRDEIAQALQLMGAQLSGDQQRELQRQIAELDAAIRREGLALQGQGLDMANDQFMRELALREYDTTNRWDYAWSGL